MNPKQFNKELGAVDLFLFDFILKYPPSEQDRILDLGCGEGRNLYYLMRNHYDVWGVDLNPEAIRFCKMLGKQFGYTDLDARFQQVDAGNLRFPAQAFDSIISINLFQHAASNNHLKSFFEESIRVLKQAGKMFLRISASNNLQENIFPLIKDIETIKKGCLEFGFQVLESKTLIEEERSATSFILYLQKK